MSEEKQKSNEIEVCFYIKRANDISISDFNTIILRLCKLRDFIERGSYNQIDIDMNNSNIEALKELLENFKIKSC